MVKLFEVFGAKISFFKKSSNSHDTHESDSSSRVFEEKNKKTN
jgi:hypothetical protein